MSDKFYKVIDYITKPSGEQWWAGAMLVFLLTSLSLWIDPEGGFIFMMKWMGLVLTLAGFVLLAAVFLRSVQGAMDYIKSENTKTKETKQYKEMEARTRNIQLSKWDNFVCKLQTFCFVSVPILLAAGTTYLLSLAVGGLGPVMWGVVSVGLFLVYFLCAAYYSQYKWKKELNDESEG